MEEKSKHTVITLKPTLQKPNEKLLVESQIWHLQLLGMHVKINLIPYHVSRT